MEVLEGLVVGGHSLATDVYVYANRSVYDNATLTSPLPRKKKHHPLSADRKAMREKKGHRGGMREEEGAADVRTERRSPNNKASGER